MSEEYVYGGSVTSAVDFINEHDRATKDTKNAFVQLLKTEPIGFLHLERLSFTPAGIERGELIYSVPLSPGEEVNISHKEWSNTSEEFERIVTDYMENFSEEGVSEKSDLAQSSSSQQQHSDGYNLSVTASGGYGPVNISASAGYNASNSSSNSAQQSRTHSMTVTRNASSRVRQEHKTSFKVASASGTEDQAIRKIKNPFLDKACRIDYYQLLRKWRVDLTRYGLRLTYDITIPEPGLDILSKLQEIEFITEELKKGNMFSLMPSDIDRENYPNKAAEQNVTIQEYPPDDKDSVLASDVHSWADSAEAFKDIFYFNIRIDVDKKYYLSKISLKAEVIVDPLAPAYAKYVTECVLEADLKDDPLPDAKFTKFGYTGWFYVDFNNYKKLLGKSGSLDLLYSVKGVLKVTTYVVAEIQLKPNEYTVWRFKAWSAIRDGAQSKYEANRQMLEKRLSDLKEELGTVDPLSLRKIEREEVMKGVIRWLFGPSFSFSAELPGGPLPEDLYREDATKINYGSLRSETAWKYVTLQGEVIKFIHHAIEWENMLYFLYPYFWSHPSRWKEKKYMNHPDIMHKVFLKSGSARVVLTIRPGFEKAFVSFIESGTLLPNQPTSYYSIATEMENYAKTNYPGIPTANPISDPRPLLLLEQRKTWEDMEKIMKLLDLYFEDPKNKKTYPLTADTTKPTTTGLAALSVYTPYKSPGMEILKVPTEDHWGNKYIYRSPGIHGEYDLSSYGADGKPGGGPFLNPDGTPNENADITSWAEGSLIGTWYEYTPTSALDIAFNETLPSG